jgi:hypothetical protein
VTFIELELTGGDTRRGVIPIRDDVRAAVAAVGVDARQYNRLVWPGIGASGWASGRFLLHADDLDELVTGMGGIGGVVSLSFGGRTFDRMYLRTPRVVLLSEASGVIYELELVDQRWLWTDDRTAIEGFNLALDDKELIYSGANAAEFDIPLELDDPDDDPQDLFIHGLPLTEVIDRLLTAWGYVLVAYPTTDWIGAEGYRYRCVPIANGEIAAASDLTTYNQDILAGGLFASIEAGGNQAPVAQLARGVGDHLEAEVPSTVTVFFPRASEGAASYKVNQEDDTLDADHVYATKRFEVKTSSQGAPAGFTGSGSAVVFDTFWAVIDELGSVVNNAALVTRAGTVAERYFDRFRCGAGDILYRGIQEVSIAANAQRVEWALSMDAVTTRVCGSWRHALFGHERTGQYLTASDVLTSGAVRAFPRPDRGLLIDAPVLPALSTYVGKITVRSGPTDATYSAVAIANSSIEVSGATPINRLLDILTVDYLAAEVDDLCLLLVDEDATVYLVTLTEQVGVSECAAAQVTTAESSISAAISTARLLEGANQNALGQSLGVGG